MATFLIINLGGTQRNYQNIYFTHFDVLSFTVKFAHLGLISFAGYFV